MNKSDERLFLGALLIFAIVVSSAGLVWLAWLDDTDPVHLIPGDKPYVEGDSIIVTADDCADQRVVCYYKGV